MIDNHILTIAGHIHLQETRGSIYTSDEMERIRALDRDMTQTEKDDLVHTINHQDAGLRERQL